MSALLRLVDGRTIAVRDTVADLDELFKRDLVGFHQFKMADNTNETRRIRLSSVIEYQRGHSK